MASVKGGAPSLEDHTRGWNADSERIWVSGAWAGHFGDAFIDDTELEGGQLPPSLRALSNILSDLAVGHGVLPLSERERGILAGISRHFADAAEFGDRSSGASGRNIPIFLRSWHERLVSMQVGELQVVPGGWASKPAGHAIMYVIERTGEDSMNFVICNTGQGVNQHPERPGHPKRSFRTSIVLRGISLQRFADEGVLYLLTQLRTTPRKMHGPLIVYDVLVPHLTGKPLTELIEATEVAYGSWAEGSLLPDQSDAVLDTPGVSSSGDPALPTAGPALGHSPWASPQRSGTCYYRAVLACLKYLLHRWGVPLDRVKAITLALRCGYLAVALRQLKAQAGLTSDTLADLPPAPASGIPLVRAASSSLRIGLPDEKHVLELKHWETKMLELGVQLTAHAAGKAVRAGILDAEHICSVADLVRGVHAFIGGDEGQFLAPPPGTPLLTPAQAAALGADPAITQVAVAGAPEPALGGLRIRVKVGMSALEDAAHEGLISAGDFGGASEQKVCTETTEDQPLVTVYVTGASLSLPPLLQLNADALVEDDAVQALTEASPAEVLASPTSASPVLLERLQAWGGFDLLASDEDTRVFQGEPAEAAADSFVDLTLRFPGEDQATELHRLAAAAAKSAIEGPCLDEAAELDPQQAHAAAHPKRVDQALSWEETLAALAATEKACDEVRQKGGASSSASQSPLHTVMSIVEHTMLEVLPAPVAWSERRAATGVVDAWTPASVTISEQRSALAIIFSLFCHYTSAWRSLPYDRNAAGAHQVTAAALAAAFDSTLRLVASDEPSPLSLLLQGVNDAWASKFAIPLVPLIEAAGIEIATDRAEAAAARAASRRAQGESDAKDDRPVQEILLDRPAYRYAAAWACAPGTSLPKFAPAFTLDYHEWGQPHTTLLALTDTALFAGYPHAASRRGQVAAYFSELATASQSKGRDMAAPPAPGQEVRAPSAKASALALPQKGGRFGSSIKFKEEDAWSEFTTFLLADMKRDSCLPPSAPALPFTDTQVASAAARGQGSFMYVGYWMSEEWEEFPEYGLLRDFLVAVTSSAFISVRGSSVLPGAQGEYYPDDMHSSWAVTRNYAAEGHGQGDDIDMQIKHMGGDLRPRAPGSVETATLSDGLALVGLKSSVRPSTAAGSRPGGSGGLMSTIMQAMMSGDPASAQDAMLEAAEAAGIELPDDPNDPQQGMAFISRLMQSGVGGSGMPGGMPMGGVPPGATPGAPGQCPMQTPVLTAQTLDDAAHLNHALVAPFDELLQRPGPVQAAAGELLRALLLHDRLASEQKDLWAAFWKAWPLLVGRGGQGGQAGEADHVASAGVDDEERILRVRDLPTFNASLSPQDSEALISLLTVRYTRIPLLLRFFSENRLGALFHPHLQLLMERVLFEPGPYAAASSLSPLTIQAVPLGSAEEHSVMATPSGLLANELWHCAEGVADPLLAIANNVANMCHGHYSSSFVGLLFYVLRLVYGVEASLVQAVEAHITSGSQATPQGKSASVALLRLRKFTLGTARAVLLKYIDQAAADFDRLGRAADAQTQPGESQASSEEVASQRSVITSTQVTLHAHHALLFAFLAQQADDGAGESKASDSAALQPPIGEQDLFYLSPEHASAMLSSVSFVTAWASQRSTFPLGDTPQEVLKAGGPSLSVPLGEVYRAMSRQRRSITTIAAAMPARDLDHLLDGVLSTALRRVEHRPGWEPASKPAFKCERTLGSPHPYLPATDTYETISFPGAESMTLSFDQKSATASERDYVIVYTSSACASYWGTGKFSLADGWPGAGGRPPLVIPADNAVVHFHSEGDSIGDWGWGLHVEATVNAPAAMKLSTQPLPGAAAASLCSSAGYDVGSIPSTIPLSWAQAAMAATWNDQAAALQHVEQHALQLAARLGLDGKATADGHESESFTALFRDGTGNVQIDLQTGEIFIGNRSRAPVPSHIASHADFASVFGSERPLASLLSSNLHAKTFELDHGLFTYRLVAWTPVGAPPSERDMVNIHAPSSRQEGDAGAAAAEPLPAPASQPLLKAEPSTVHEDDDMLLSEQATHRNMPLRIRGSVEWRGQKYSTRWSPTSFEAMLEEVLVSALTSAQLPPGTPRQSFLLPEGVRQSRSSHDVVAAAMDAFSSSRLTARVLHLFEWMAPAITATAGLVEDHIIRTGGAQQAGGGDVDKAGTGRSGSRMWASANAVHRVAADILRKLNLHEAAAEQEAQADAMCGAGSGAADPSTQPATGDVLLRALWFVPPQGDFIKRLGKPGTWFSLEVSATRQVVQVYQLVESGRRTLRSLVACSDGRAALRSIDVVPSTMQPDQLLHARHAVASPFTESDPAALIAARTKSKTRAPSRRWASSKPKQGPAPSSIGSIIVSRKFAAAGDAGAFSRTWEEHVPEHLLYGSLPHALLEAYDFWKGTRPALPQPVGSTKFVSAGPSLATVLRGYPRDDSADSILEVDIASDGSGHAIVRRFSMQAFRAHCRVLADISTLRRQASKAASGAAPALAVSESAAWSKYVAAMSQMDEGAVCTLLNVSSGSLLSPARRIADTLSRIESISHVLVWSHSFAFQGANVSVSKVELPRLKTSFSPRLDEEGRMRVYCDEFSGHYLSDDRDTSILRHMKGIPHSVLLSNRAGEHSILVPNLPLHRPAVKAEPFTTDIITCHGEGWESAVSTRLYRYPVHASGAFLAVPSVAAAWYLVLLRLMHRDYEGAAELLPACATDVAFSSEEAWVAAMVNRTAGFDEDSSEAPSEGGPEGQGEVKIDAPDMHPNAHALRLRLALIQFEAGMLTGPLVPKVLARDFTKYVSKQPHVAAFARLSPSEEVDVVAGIKAAAGPDAGDFASGRQEYASALVAVAEESALQTERFESVRAELRAQIAEVDLHLSADLGASADGVEGAAGAPPPPSPASRPSLTTDVSTLAASGILRSCTVQTPHPFAGSLLVEGASRQVARTQRNADSSGGAAADQQRSRVLWQLQWFKGGESVEVAFSEECTLGMGPAELRVYAVEQCPPQSSGDGADPASSEILELSGTFDSETDIPASWELLDTLRDSAKGNNSGQMLWPGVGGMPALIADAPGVALVYVQGGGGAPTHIPRRGGLVAVEPPWGWKAVVTASVPITSGAEAVAELWQGVKLSRQASSKAAEEHDTAKLQEQRAQLVALLEGAFPAEVTRELALGGPSMGTGSSFVRGVLEAVEHQLQGTGQLKEGAAAPVYDPLSEVVMSYDPAPTSLFQYVGTLADSSSSMGVPREVQQARYVRPKPASDTGGHIEWWELLEKVWNDDTPGLMDTPSRPGWAFLYEVLTSAVPVDITALPPKEDPSMRQEEEEEGESSGGAAASGSGRAASTDAVSHWYESSREGSGGTADAPCLTSSATATYVRLILLSMLAHHSAGPASATVPQQLYLVLLGATVAAAAASRPDVAVDVFAKSSLSAGEQVEPFVSADAGPEERFTLEQFPLLPLHDEAMAIMAQERGVCSMEYFLTRKYQDFPYQVGAPSDVAQAFTALTGQQGHGGGQAASRMGFSMWHRGTNIGPILWARIVACVVRGVNSGAWLHEKKVREAAHAVLDSSGTLAVLPLPEVKQQMLAAHARDVVKLTISLKCLPPPRAVVDDTSCAARFLQRKTAGVAPEDLEQFASSPLGSLAQGDGPGAPFVQLLPGPGNDEHPDGPLLDALPFQLGETTKGMAAVESYVGAQMLERMASDLDASAQKARSKKVPQLTVLCDTKLSCIQAAVSAADKSVQAALAGADGHTLSLEAAAGFSDEAAQVVTDAMAELERLQNHLQGLRARDSAQAAAAQRALVRAANWTSPSTESSPSEVAERLTFSMLRAHGDSAWISFPLLAAVVMSPSPQAVLSKLNPFLSEEGIDQLLCETQVLLLRCNRISQLARCVADVSSVMDRLSQLLTSRLSAAAQLSTPAGHCAPSHAIVCRALEESAFDPRGAAELLSVHLRSVASASEAVRDALSRLPAHAGEGDETPQVNVGEPSKAADAAHPPSSTASPAARLERLAPRLAALALQVAYKEAGALPLQRLSAQSLQGALDKALSRLCPDTQAATLRALLGDHHTASSSSPRSSDSISLRSLAFISWLLECVVDVRCAWEGTVLSVPAAPARLSTRKQCLEVFADRVKSSSAMLHVLRHAAMRLAGQLTARRHFMHAETGGWRYDPRFLVFEFVSTFILRRRQVELVIDFLKAAYAGESNVSQMIMGQGKTTVIGPLLALVLADGRSLVTQVCPAPLLDQTKSVLRGVFCSVIAKRILTLKFERSSPLYFPDEAAGGPAAGIEKLKGLVRKLQRAKRERAIVATTPETLKSMMLKYVDLLATVASAPVESRMDIESIPARAVRDAAGRSAASLWAAGAAADQLRNLIALWGGTAVWDGVLAESTGGCDHRFPGLNKKVPSKGLLLLDEVDLLLHSLRSELNFPVGIKHRLNMWPRRWEFPIHLLDALFASCDPTSGVAQLLSEGIAPAASQASPDEGDSEVAEGSSDQLDLSADSVTSGMGRVSVPGFRSGSESDSILRELRHALADGVASFAMQPLPHPTLLSPAFYEARLRPVLARWAMLWLRSQSAVQRTFGSLPLAAAAPVIAELLQVDCTEPAGVAAARAAAARVPDTRSLAGDFLVGDAPVLGGAAEEHILAYVQGCPIPSSPPAQWLQEQQRLAEEEAVSLLSAAAAVDEGIADAERAELASQPALAMQCVNLVREWITTFMPHCMSKINRVSYGLLTPRDLARYTQEMLGRMPRSRRLLAVPFVGKDVPSDASEFAHPEVLIGLSICAMRYEGLRRSDLKVVLDSMKSDLQNESGRMENRPTRVLFSDWLARADADFKQVLEAVALPAESKQALSQISPAQSVLPLELAQPREATQFDSMYSALRRSPEIITHYLRQHVFMEVMRHQDIKLTATGVDLGSDMLFGTRLGFSGTPSDLLPLSLRPCHYEPGSEADIVRVLTDESLVSAQPLDAWSVTSLLKHIAKASPPFHALIDTGALVTGMNNEQVARFLLSVGLPGMRGCVFLDDKDRKSIVLREGGAPMPLAECGIPPHERFCFYDQTHCTGMHIDQALNARAAITLGKDMTLRDYAQGAWRMRGLGKGQTLTAVVVPEVRELIEGVVSRQAPHAAQGGSAAGTGLSRQTGALGPQTSDGEGGSPLPPAPALSLTRSLSSSVPADVQLSSRPSGLTLSLPAAVVAWLTFNSIKSEQLQFLALCQQNVAYAWRRTAFTDLIRTSQPSQAQFKVSRLGLKTRFHAPVTRAEVEAFLHTIPAEQVPVEFPDSASNEPSGHGQDGRLAALLERDPESLTTDEQLELALLMSALDAPQPAPAEAEDSGDATTAGAGEGEAGTPTQSTEGGAAGAGTDAEPPQPGGGEPPVELVRGNVAWLRMCVEVFREPLDMSIPSDVPEPQPFEAKLAAEAARWKELISAEEDKAVLPGMTTKAYVAAILEEAAQATAAQGEDAYKSNSHDAEVVQEQEKESEQEAQVEIQQEVEVQFADGSDTLMPWPLTALRSQSLSSEEAAAVASLSGSQPPAAPLGLQSLLADGMFYSMQDFELLRGREKLAFPAGLLVSQNHTPQLASPTLPRRLRNVVVILQLADRGGSGDDSSVMLSLLEAQTVRRAVHLRHPALRHGLEQAPSLALRLAEGGAVLDVAYPRNGDEGSAGRIPPSTFTKQRLAAQFFNNTAWFSEPELLGLLSALKDATPRAREAFYAECIVGRRRDKQTWAETALGTLFKEQDETRLSNLRRALDAAGRVWAEKHGGSLKAAFVALAGGESARVSTAALKGCLMQLSVPELDEETAEQLAASADGDDDRLVDWVDVKERFTPPASPDSRARHLGAHSAASGLKDALQLIVRHERSRQDKVSALLESQAATSEGAAEEVPPSPQGEDSRPNPVEDREEVFVAKTVANRTGTIADHLNASEVLSVGELLLTSGGGVAIDSDVVVSTTGSYVASVSPRRVLLRRSAHYFETTLVQLSESSAASHARVAAVGWGDARFTGSSSRAEGVGDTPCSWSFSVLAVPPSAVSASSSLLPGMAAAETVHVGLFRLGGQAYAGSVLRDAAPQLDMLAPHAAAANRQATVLLPGHEDALHAILLMEGDNISTVVDVDSCAVSWRVNDRAVETVSGQTAVHVEGVRGGFVASLTVTAKAAVQMNTGNMPFRFLPPPGVTSLRRAGRRTQEVKVVREAGDAAGRFVATAEVEGLSIKNNTIMNVGFFPTAVCAGVLLTTGKWYYEATVLRKGNGSQIGWGDIEFCGLGGGRGVGDDEHSFAFDGERVCLWHRQNSPGFGRAWHTGDTVGFAVDLDRRTLSFGINGQWKSPLGVAFRDIKFVCGLTPAVTPQGKDTAFAVNLGERPMRYPPPETSYGTVWQWLVAHKPDLKSRTRGGAAPGQPLELVNNPTGEVYGVAGPAAAQGTGISADAASELPASVPLTRGVSTLQTVASMQDELSIPLRVSSGFRLVSRRGKSYELTVKGSLPPSVVGDGVAVHSGKWYYEVLVSSKTAASSVIVGWADARFSGRWARRATVGDDSASWGWAATAGEFRHSGKSHPLKPKQLGSAEQAMAAPPVPVRAGSILGVAVDVDAGRFTFTLNGEWDTRAESGSASSSLQPRSADSARKADLQARLAAAAAEEDWDKLEDLQMELSLMEAIAESQADASTEVDQTDTGAAAPAVLADLASAGVVDGTIEQGIVGGLTPAVSAAHDTSIVLNFGGPEGEGFRHSPPSGYQPLHLRLVELQQGSA